MFNFGFSELLLVIIALIIIIPPKELPKLFHHIGYWYKRGQVIYSRFMNEIQDITDQATEDIKPPSNTRHFKK